jgi:hypothetical protein
MDAVIKKDRTSLGLNNILVELFKYWGSKLKEQLLALFNIIWKSKQIPKDWEEGLVISVFKKGNANDCGNYRGITLL